MQAWAGVSDATTASASGNAVHGDIVGILSVIHLPMHMPVQVVFPLRAVINY